MGKQVLWLFSKFNISGTVGPILMIQKASFLVMMCRIWEKYFFGIWTKGGEAKKCAYIWFLAHQKNFFFR
jgi:hypothetical protein